MFKKFKLLIAALAATVTFSGCSQSISIETKPYDEVRKEAESYSFKAGSSSSLRRLLRVT